MYDVKRAKKKKKMKYRLFCRNNKNRSNGTEMSKYAKIKCLI